MQPMGVQYGWHDPVKTNRSNPQGHEATPVHKESTNVKIRGCMQSCNHKRTLECASARATLKC